MEKTLSELNFYCYTRFKVDELGLAELEGLTPSSVYAPYYTVLDVESELLYRPLDDKLPLRCDWDKAKRDFSKYTQAFLHELNDQTSWTGVIGLVAAAKMFVRRYKATNPLFASMFCVEMLLTLNDLGDVSFLSWRKVAKKYSETLVKETSKRTTKSKESSTPEPSCVRCIKCDTTRTLKLMVLAYSGWSFYWWLTGR